LEQCLVTVKIAEWPAQRRSVAAFFGVPGPQPSQALLYAEDPGETMADKPRARLPPPDHWSRATSARIATITVKAPARNAFHAAQL